MAVTDFWEVESGSESEIWQKLIGHDHEDLRETYRQVGVIENGIPSWERILEIGAGVGRLMKRMSGTRDGHKPEVHGIDSSISMVTLGQGYLQDCPNCTLVLSDGQHIPYPDNSFDFVYAFTVWQHFRSLAMIHRNLCEVRRVLKPSCLCRIQTVIAKPDTSPRDFSSYDGRVMESVNEFEEMFRGSGLEVVKSETGLTHPEHVWVTGRKP